MTEKQSLEHLVAKLCFDYAVRALLGDGKGTAVMEQLERDSSELYNEVMKAARLYIEQVAKQRLEVARAWEDGMMRLAEDLEKEGSN